MLSHCRNLELKTEICDIIGYRRHDEPCPESEKERQKWNRRLSKEEWDLSQELRALLALPHQAVIAFQAQEKPTLSQVAPFVVAIRATCNKIRDLETKPPVIRKTAMSIASGLKARFSSVLDNPIYSIATLVDPDTKCWFASLPQHVAQIVKDFVSSKIAVSEANRANPTPANHPLHGVLCASVTTNSIPFDLNQYIHSPFVPPVAQFFASQPSVFQELYLSICGIPAASSEIERLFSTCGYVNSKLRCSMKSENVEQRSLLKKNTAVIEEFERREHSYPTSTPKLVDWVISLPASCTFFANDHDINHIEGIVC